MNATDLARHFEQQLTLKPSKLWFCKITPKEGGNKIIELLTLDLSRETLDDFATALADYKFSGYLNDGDKPRFVHNDIKE